MVEVIPDSNDDELNGDRGIIPMILVPAPYRTTISQLVDGIWYVVSIATVILNIIAMALNESAISVVSGIATLVVSPVIMYNQTKLDNLDSLRSVQNQIRNEVNRLAEQNILLGTEVTKLKVQNQTLKSESSKLEDLSKSQNVSVDKLKSLILENKKALDELKELVKADLTQTLVSAVIESDYDSSNTFSDQEIDVLITRVSYVQGVKVNTALLRQELSDVSNRTLTNILGYLDHFDRTDLPPDKVIFDFDDSFSPPETSG